MEATESKHRERNGHVHLDDTPASSSAKCCLVYTPPEDVVTKSHRKWSERSKKGPIATAQDTTAMLRQARMAAVEGATVARQRQELTLLLEELKERDAELNRSATTAQSTMVAWQRDRTTLQAQEEQIASLQGEIDAGREQLRSATSRLRLAESESAQRETALNNAQSQIKQLAAQQSKVQLQISELQTRNEHVTTTNRELNKTIGQLEAREQELLTMLQLKDKDLSETCRHLSEVSARLKRAEVSLESSRRSEAEQRRAAAEWRNKYSQAWHDQDHYQRELGKLESRCEKQHQEIQQLRHDKSALQSDLTVTGEREARLRQVHELQRSAQERWDGETQRLRDLCAQQERDLAVLRAHLQTSRDVIDKQQQRYLAKGISMPSTDASHRSRSPAKNASLPVDAWRSRSPKSSASPERFKLKSTSPSRLTEYPRTASSPHRSDLGQRSYSKSPVRREASRGGRERSPLRTMSPARLASSFSPSRSLRYTASLPHYELFSSNTAAVVVGGNVSGLGTPRHPPRYASTPRPHTSLPYTSYSGQSTNTKRAVRTGIDSEKGINDTDIITDEKMQIKGNINGGNKDGGTESVENETGNGKDEEHEEEKDDYVLSGVSLQDLTASADRLIEKYYPEGAAKWRNERTDEGKHGCGGAENKDGAHSGNTHSLIPASDKLNSQCNGAELKLLMDQSEAENVVESGPERGGSHAGSEKGSYHSGVRSAPFSPHSGSIGGSRKSSKTESVHSARGSVHSQRASVHNDHGSVHSDRESVHSQRASVHNDHGSVHSDRESVHSQRASVHNNHGSVHSDRESVHSHRASVRNDQGSVHSDRESVHSQQASVHNDHSSVHSDRGSVHSQRSSVHNDQGSVHSDRESVHSNQASVHSYRGSVHNSQGSVHSAKNSVHSNRDSARNSVAKEAELTRSQTSLQSIKTEDDVISDKDSVHSCHSLTRSTLSAHSNAESHHSNGASFNNQNDPYSQHSYAESIHSNAKAPSSHNTSLHSNQSASRSVHSNHSNAVKSSANNERMFSPPLDQMANNDSPLPGNASREESVHSSHYESNSVHSFQLESGGTSDASLVEEVGAPVSVSRDAKPVSRDVTSPAFCADDQAGAVTPRGEEEEPKAPSKEACGDELSGWFSSNHRENKDGVIKDRAPSRKGDRHSDHGSLTSPLNGSLNGSLSG